MTGRPQSAHATTSDPGPDRLKAVLDGWRNSLLDMGGRNRLLNFRHTRTATLELTSPDAIALLAGLGKGWGFAPVAEERTGPSGPPVPPGGPGQGVDLDKPSAPDRAPEAADRTPAADRAPGTADRAPGTADRTPHLADRTPGNPTRPGLRTQKTTQSGLDSALYQLRLKSGQMYNDYGLWVLWLGIGMLDWCEEGAQETSSAPLLLVPVELRRDRDRRFRLRPAEGQDRTHNPALAVKLERMGVDWSAVTGTDVTDPAAVLAAAREVAAAQPGWRVGERAVLGLFASHREAMYQDLQQNEERILAHPLVRAVGLGPDSGLPDDVIGFEPPELDRIDEIQLPEKTPLVLDADASQRQCIAAALDNRSFVMSGPPGTGKSQTITNMIAALLHAGRSVLFVSEKAAALDVVHNRLRGVGLGDFVLALHSGDTSKKAVATELARVLTTEARVTGAAEHELARARRLREDLSGYAAAMNETRAPLDRSLHDVLGRLVQLELSGTPLLPLAARDVQNTTTVRTLSAGALQELHTAAQAISRAWRPAAEGEAFAWRGLTGTAAHQVVTEARDALDALLTATGRRPFAATQGEPRSVRELQGTVRILRAGLPDSGRPVTPGPGTPLPEDVSHQLAQLADLFGMPKGDSAEAAFALCELADLTTAEHRPPRAWFDPTVLRLAQLAAQELRRALDAETGARRAADDVFGEQVLRAAGLPDLVHRFTDSHRGVMARFSAQFKADRAAVAALTRTGNRDKAVVGRLDQALAWQRAAAEVARLADQHAALLGRYAHRTNDGVDALRQALATADRIAALTRDAVRDDLLPDQLAAETAEIAEIAETAETAETAEIAEIAEAAVTAATVESPGTTAADAPDTPDNPNSPNSPDNPGGAAEPHTPGRAHPPGGPDRLPALLAGNIRRALGDWCEITDRRAERWSDAVTALLGLFDDARTTQLAPSLLGTFDQAQQVIGALLADPHGPDEWQAYRDGLAVLARHGADQLVAVAAERGVDPGQLPGVVEQALLRSWADGVL
ncbi:DUF4011 domain-containing protein, partial [Streptomyces sp. NPDC055078]